MSGAIENGRRAPVKFGSHAGSAGVVERDDGTWRVAFFADLRSMRGVETGMIDGVACRVLSAKRSDPAAAGVAGMVVLTVKPIDN